ncbi:hypothetical protein RFI_25814 [Reticulomyxa filosa]|uniref:Uncharacterized protein n=1 Tax=Reticulomyxa filosa TaxID=46433 RepID=X6MDR3_RETFI|nr:hypothetical protein RFI_25814 [Reticulomyxa filosa]|eukprot:ETO11562.1 hypothetical protein RFI_25814 [Reticulomyxa filosa]
MLNASCDTIICPLLKELKLIDSTTLFETDTKIDNNNDDNDYSSDNNYIFMSKELAIVQKALKLKQIISTKSTSRQSLATAVQDTTSYECDCKKCPKQVATEQDLIVHSKVDFYPCQLLNLLLTQPIARPFFWIVTILLLTNYCPT